jgi:hypothetical protein
MLLTRLCPLCRAPAGGGGGGSYATADSAVEGAAGGHTKFGVLTAGGGGGASYDAIYSVPKGGAGGVATVGDFSGYSITVPGAAGQGGNYVDDGTTVSGGTGAGTFFGAMAMDAEYNGFGKAGTGGLGSGGAGGGVQESNAYTGGQRRSTALPPSALSSQHVLRWN